MPSTRHTRSRGVVAALAAAALVLTCTPAANAGSQFFADPDEANTPADSDIEWTAVDHPPSVSGRIVRHTVKTRAPYSVQPIVYIRAGGRTYKVYGSKVHGQGPDTLLSLNTSPAGAPDTVSYTFNLSQIGDPTSYEWWAATAGGTLTGDRAPVPTATHWVGPLVSPGFRIGL